MGDGDGDVSLLRVGDEELVVLTMPALSTQTLLQLSSAERDVLALTLGGQSNASIARARGTAARTVANQLSSIFRKLGVVSRAELVARLAGTE